MIRFIVFSMPRTGSTMLTQRLSTHPDVICYPAVFSEKGWFKPGKASGGLLGRLQERMNPRWNDVALRVAERQGFLDELFETSREKSAVGFKYHLPGMAELSSVLYEGDLHKVLLTRNNFLAAYSSNKVAAVTGQGAASVGENIISGKCTFEAIEFDAFRQRREKIYKRAKDAIRGELLEIDYTDARTYPGIAKLAKFLEVDPSGIGQAPTLKRNSDVIVERFNNPEVALEHLKMSGLEHLASEGSLA